MGRGWRKNPSVGFAATSPGNPGGGDGDLPPPSAFAGHLPPEGGRTTGAIGRMFATMTDEVPPTAIPSPEDLAALDA